MIVKVDLKNSHKVNIFYFIFDLKQKIFADLLA